MLIDQETIAAFAPTGTLRASINVGNPILARRDEAGKSARGVSVDLAGELARRLGVGLELIVFETAGESVQAVASGQADVGFFAIDPARGKDIAFTDAYILIEGCYMVREASPLRDNSEVDAAGTRVTVGRGSAYDLYLTRTLEHAEIVRAASSQAVIETFLRDDLDVAAGVKQQLLADARPEDRLRLLPGRFMEIRQAMGLPKARGERAALVLHEFVEDMKSSGFVSNALRSNRVSGAEVAQAANGDTRR